MVVEKGKEGVVQLVVKMLLELEEMVMQTVVELAELEWLSLELVVGVEAMVGEQSVVPEELLHVLGLVVLTEIAVVGELVFADYILQKRLDYNYCT